MDLRLEMLQESPPNTELQIMSTFLLQERKRHKCLGRLEGKTEEPQTPAKAGTKCYAGNKEGHRFFKCPDKSKSGKKTTARAHASMKVVPKVCPACHAQHSFKDDKGETLYRTRLSSCPTFCNLGAGDRANLVQSAVSKS